MLYSTVRTLHKNPVFQGNPGETTMKTLLITVLIGAAEASSFRIQSSPLEVCEIKGHRSHGLHEHEGTGKVVRTGDFKGPITVHMCTAHAVTSEYHTHRAWPDRVFAHHNIFKYFIIPSSRSIQLTGPPREPPTFVSPAVPQQEPTPCRTPQECQQAARMASTSALEAYYLTEGSILGARQRANATFDLADESQRQAAAAQATSRHATAQMVQLTSMNASLQGQVSGLENERDEAVGTAAVYAAQAAISDQAVQYLMAAQQQRPATDEEGGAE